MKILLLGEFSSLHANLKDGLVELGHDVTIAASGDGFKKIPCDINLDGRLPGKLKFIDNIYLNLTSINAFSDYDIVQVISPFYMYYHKLPFCNVICSKFFKEIKKNNGKLFFLAAGDDSIYWRKSRYLLKYGPFNDALLYDYKSDSYFMESEKTYEYNINVVNISDGIIPVMYEYNIGYADNKKLKNVIPLPLNSEKIHWLPSRKSKKIKVFHGLNRYGFKGTKLVEEAFKILGSKHKDILHLTINGQMPLKNYLEIMQDTHIIIDQMYSYSLGMNGLYGLAMGKIVLGGNEEVASNMLYGECSPAFNVTPDAYSIVDIIEEIINQRYDIEAISEASREFVLKHHDHIKVALKYVETWKS